MTELDSLHAGARTLPPPAGPAHSPRPQRRQRRRHPAVGSRIAAAGLGVSTMFGLVATMGIAATADSEAAPAPTATLPSVTLPVAPLPGVAPSAPVTVPVARATAAAATLPPVMLTARPDVRVVTVPAPAAQQAPAAAPAATTRGSG